MNTDRILTPLTVLALILGVYTRVCGAQGELWLDEIWTLELVRDITDWRDILVLNHDNNHILNSLWMWVLGSHADAFSYRSLSLIASSLAVVLLGTAALLRKDREMIVWSWLFALSYPLIVLGSEARGYGTLMLSVISAWLWITRKNFKDSFLDIVVLGTISIIGALSHPTWIFIIPGIFAYFLFTGRKVFLSLAFSLFPCLFLMWAFYSGLELGGGPIQNFLEVILNQVSALVFCSTLTLQNIALSAALFLGAFVAIGVSAYGIILAWGERDTCSEEEKPNSSRSHLLALPVLSRENRGLSLLVSVFIAPLLSLLLLQPDFLLPRYFTIPGIFFLYSLSIFLAKNIRPAFLFLLLFSFVSLARVTELFLQGRGNFSEIAGALKNQPLARIGTNQFFQLSKLLEYHFPGNSLKILHLRPRIVAPEFVIINQHSVETLAPEIARFFVHTYHLEGQALAAQYTGPSWIIYRISKNRTKPQ